MKEIYLINYLHNDHDNAYAETIAVTRNYEFAKELLAETARDIKEHYPQYDHEIATDEKYVASLWDYSAFAQVKIQKFIID